MNTDWTYAQPLRLVAVLALVFGLLFAASVASAKVVPSVTAQVDRTRIDQYDRVTLEVRVSAGGSSGDPDIPVTSQWEVVGHGESTQIRIVNFKKSVSKVYQYKLLPLKTGQLEIPSIRVEIDGKRYSTRPIRVTVRPHGGAGDEAAGGADAAAAAKDEGTFIQVVVEPEGGVLVGQKVIVSYYLVTRVNLAGWGYQQLPALDGFWNETLELADANSSLSGVEIERGGQRYLRTILARFAIFPVAAGDLTLDPLVVQVVQMTRNRRSNSPFDEFFGRAGRGRELVVSSPPITIHVDEPPLEGRPAGFAGAVGNFVIRSEADATAVKAGEAITYRVKIAGDANAKSLAPPVLDLPPGFKEYTPKESAEVLPIPHDYRMEKEFAYILVPEKPGEFTIPPAKLHYFDPAAGGYRTIESDPIAVSVAPGDASAQAAPRAVMTKEEIRLEGQDIRHIKPSPVNGSSRGGSVLQSPFAWLALALFPLLIAGVYVGSVVRERREADVVGTRRRRAVGEAKRRLKKARALAGSNDPAAFYGELQRAVTRYVADKTNAGSAVLSAGDVADRLRGRGAEESVVADVTGLLETCELYRFAAQATEGGSMRADVDRAAAAIDALERAKGVR